MSLLSDTLNRHYEDRRIDGIAEQICDDLQDELASETIAANALRLAGGRAEWVAEATRRIVLPKDMKSPFPAIVQAVKDQVNASR